MHSAEGLAMTDESQGLQASQRPTRPILVWFIVLFYLFLVMLTLFQISSELPPNVSLGQAILANISTFSFFDYMNAILSLVCGLGGLLALFFLKKVAVLLLSIRWVIYVSEIIFHMVVDPLPGSFFSSAMVGTLLGIGFNSFVPYYAFSLKRQGLLT